MTKIFELKRYQTNNGRVPFSRWLDDLEDKTANRILAYVDRMKTGNFGNSKPVGKGVSELKLDFGSGYRVYYLCEGHSIVILLCGGDKGTQKKDIKQAQYYAEDYQRRSK